MRLLAPLLLTAVLAAGCTSGSDEPDAPAFRPPAETAFSEGTCRLAAPDVVAVGQQAHDLGDAVPPEAATLLRESQSRLDALAESAEPAVKTPLSRLVVAIGAVRIRSDSGTYESSLARDVIAAYDAVVSACTAPA